MLRVRRQRARVARLSAWLFVSLSTLSSVAGCGGSEATARLDSKAPVVLSVSPPDPYTAVPVDANVEATFSKPIEPSAINNDTFTLVRAGSLATVSALVSYDPSTRKATLDPTRDLDPTAVYSARLTTGVTDTSGNPMADDREWLITTAGGALPAGALIKREAAATVVNTTPTRAVTVAKPAGTVSGDVLVACLALNTRRVVAGGAPPDWAPIASETSIPNPHVFGYYKVTGDSEPADYTWLLSSAAQSSGGIARYSGVDTNSPIEAVGTSASKVIATAGTIAGVTTTTPMTMLVGCIGVNSSTAAVAFTSPQGMANVWDLAGKRHALAEGLQASAGPSGDKTWSFRARREWAGWLAALRPAG
ncbi:MAG: hypothetical protein E6G06_07365 [Actinobacteria bacterium]|nr:MAG: hypothetical protein E6G06_07365 [Actinomycetota bacterium]